ncbi:MAG: tripartite tricarboxylate transporter TctB family protein [Actinomycetota bacterium]
MTSREVDIVAGVIFVALGGFVLMQSLQLDFYIEGVPGPGFFPALLAIAMSVSGALLVVTRSRAGGEAAEEFKLPSRWQAKRSLGLWIAVLASSLLVGVVGFLAAMFLLVAVILLVIEGRRGIVTIVTIVATPLLAYLLFASLLQVPLPAGVFGS